MRFLWSPFQEAAANAGVEEFLFRQRPLQPTLLFYQNESSVLWGRNQNPFQECAVSKCRGEGIPLIRRISGGGTVYHDGGNLNYCFILPKAVWDPAKWVALVVKGIQQLLPTQLVYACDRHSIWVDSRKVSGSAFALSGPAVLFHGCILLHTDLDRLNELLTPESTAGAYSKSIASVRSPVANLSEFSPGISSAALMNVLVCEVNQGLPSPLELLDLDPEILQPYQEKFLDPKWNFERVRNLEL